MKLVVQTKNLATLKTDLVAIPVFKGRLDRVDELATLDRKLRGRLKYQIRAEKFSGEMGSHVVVQTGGLLPFREIQLLGLGEPEKWNLEVLRRACGQITRLAQAKQVSRLTVLIPDFDASSYRYSASPEEIAQVIAEGVTLGGYRFFQYRKPKRPLADIATLHLYCSRPELADSVRVGAERGVVFGEATAIARDLVNEPPSNMTPTILAGRAGQLMKSRGIRFSLWKQAELRRMGMNAYLAVSRGSEEPPVGMRFEYNASARNLPHIMVIGKGVTFDSGGLSIKGAKGMENMKDDMSGAAAVVGLFAALGKMKLPVRVTGMILATENMPDGKAVKPGDVVKAYNGKTIEILNTDAEGRLTLADALSYTVKEIKPDRIIDLATLTGACLVALGDLMSAAIGNNKEFLQEIQLAGQKAGETYWELPLFEDYRDLIKSDVADIKNTGGAYGGTITAALFLSEFVDSTPWVHLDIAGPAWSDRESGYHSRGGTGVGVRTLLNYLMTFGTKSASENEAAKASEKRPRRRTRRGR